VSLCCKSDITTLADHLLLCLLLCVFQAGVYVVYEGQKVNLSDQQLADERRWLPLLPPSMYGINSSCRCCRTLEQVEGMYGAVHGQRVSGE